jgi:transcription antitermination factor NusG
MGLKTKFLGYKLIITEIELMHWYALYTKPRHEKKVNDQLEGKGIISFLPMVEQLRQWKDRRKKVWIPLFNSYVFVKIDLKDRYNALQTHGVVRLVSFGGEPAAIPDWQIEQLQQVIEKPDSLILEEYLREGDWVSGVD